MYFNSEAQGKILARFHFALNSNGYLFLGKAEMLFAHARLFVPTDIKRRVFTKVRKASLRDHMMRLPQTVGDAPPQLLLNSNVLTHVRLRDAAFDADPVAQIIIDASGTLSFINERARTLFALNNRDLGRPLQDLEISYRPAELRSCIEQAQHERRTITLKDVEWRGGNEDVRHLDIQIIPLFYNASGVLGAKIIFSDVTRYNQLQEELRLSRQELETAYEELQSTNEELETMNEELQSSNEELETINEELRQQG